ncbi:hypothetical protein CN952_16655, partial [Bacillus cereus]|uniref:hypothetical protein n=1 Tax=Bacillus cereus TaxID=1396 RepID=UPI000C031E2A
TKCHSVAFFIHLIEYHIHKTESQIENFRIPPSPRATTPAAMVLKKRAPFLTQGVDPSAAPSDLIHTTYFNIICEILSNPNDPDGFLPKILFL